MPAKKAERPQRVIRDAADLRLDLWNFFQVTVQVQNQLRGGTPKNPSIIDAWLRSAVKDKSRIHMLIDEAKADLGIDKMTEAEEAALVSGLKDSSWNGFRRDPERGLFLSGYKVKAMLKESANILKDAIKITAFKKRVAEHVFVMEERVFLGVDKPDGTDECPIHVMTRQGPRTSLKRMDYVERPRLTYHLQVLNLPLKRNTDDAQIWPSAFLVPIFDCAEKQGQGADRALGYGQFKVEELVALEERPDVLNAFVPDRPDGEAGEDPEHLENLAQDLEAALDAVN